MKISIRSIKKKIKTRLFYHTYNKRYNLIIFDDLLPSGMSPWRTYEFSELVKQFKNSKIITSLSTFRKFYSGMSVQDSLNILISRYPDLENKITYKRILNGGDTNLFYCIFYNNIVANFTFLKRRNIPFLFTLYPGGGFLLNNENVNKNLNLLFSAPNFRGVIVNQLVTKRYLIANTCVNKKSIFYIPGMPLNLNSYDDEIISGKDFDNEISILFMANKYSDRGKDKGFNIFEEVASYLLQEYPTITFDILGNFDEADLINKRLLGNFTFHGQVDESEFGKVLNKTHLIISPNSPFKLNNGAFDGFPLGSCVTAGYFKNALFMTDYFDESASIQWRDDFHFCKINFASKDITNEILPYLKNRKKLKALATNAHFKIREDYSYERQVLARLEIFDKFVG